MHPRIGQPLFLTLVCALLLPSPAPASKLDARARVALARVRAGTEPVGLMRLHGAALDRDGALDVFITGDVTRADLESAGAHVRTELPGLFTASIPASAVDRVAALSGVAAIRGGAPCAPELAVSVPTTGATLLRGPGPAFAGLNGHGVLIGIVDSGVDYGHGDFQDSTGASRIVSIWDQVASGIGVPGYPYGKVCTSAQIAAGTCPEADSLEHGTHVAGIAAGDGSQTAGGKPAFTYAGMAPAADVVAVKTDFLTPEVIDGIRYVFGQATARGENAVVNLSLGSQFGSHDGASEFERGVSALVGPGRIVVKSAGNDRGTALHGRVFATGAGSSATIVVAGSAAGRLFGIDGYYNGTERLRVLVRTPNGTNIGPLALNTENAPWPGQSTLNGSVYVAHDSLDAGRRNVYLEVYCELASKSMNGTWTMTLLADQLGASNGRVDLWRFLTTTGLTANFAAGNLPTQGLISEPGNAPDVITVGAWVTRSGWTGCNGILGSYVGTPPAGALASFSSPGPTRDGRLKPDLVAPGSAIGATTSFDIPHACPAPPAVSEYLDDGGNHRVFAGTSTAAPHVAGAVALLLQKFGALSPQQVTDYLRTHAVTDGFTGPVPNNDWGYGKLQLGDLIDPIAHVLAPNGGEQRLIGDGLVLGWPATDALGGVTSVDLELSRAGSGGPFEPIALGTANTGSYAWSVTGPSTPPGQAYFRVRAHDANGNVGVDVSDLGFTIVDPSAGVEHGSGRFELTTVGPNPAIGGVQIQFSLAHESRIRLSVCDLMGREVAVLAEGVRPGGDHLATWSGATTGAAAATGIYFIRLQTPSARWTRRVVLLH